VSLLDPPDYVTDYRLSRREADVCRLLLGGLENKSIARLLNLEVQTVKDHMSAILCKTHSHNRTQAALRLVGY
jgi:DNA-binding NarL/FixJ family response regulator